MWISDGQNYVFFTSFAKPKVVVYEGFSQFGGLDFEVKNNKITPSPKSLIWRDFYIFGDLTKILCFFMISSAGVPPIANLK